MRSLRIAWVLYGSLERRTGGTIYDAEVVAGLRRGGDDVHALELANETRSVTAGFGIPWPRLGQAFGVVKRGLDLARRIAALAPDVVVGDELCFAELAVAFRGRRTKTGSPKRVLLVHHLTAWETERPLLQRRLFRAVEGYAVEASCKLITTSLTTRNRLLAEGTRKPIAVVWPGADRLPRALRLEHANGVRFVFIGALIARKRVVTLVRAFRAAYEANGGATLLLVGSTTCDPTYVAEVRRVVKTLGLERCIEMKGELTEAGVARALNSADVLVMPSSLEGYGIAATEAIYAGVPVIAARAQGLEEALAPCPAACFFADDETSLACIMQDFATTTELRAAMRAAAQAASCNMPTWQGCAAAFRKELDV